MKAVVVEHRGEAGSLKEIPVPQPGPDQILVRVAAAGVNPIDWKRRDRPNEKFPFVLGQDFAGVVSAPGAGIRTYREGERVFGIAGEHGSYAEYTIASERDDPIAKIPDSVGDAEAAALPTAGLTALAAIEALHVTKGMTLLVLGATGGVGGFAVQIAHDRGVRVIGTGRSSSDAFARSLGVDEFIAYDRQNAVQAVKATHPDGIDAALDLVDDADAIKALTQIVHAEGRIVSTVHSADVEWFARKTISAQNIGLFGTPQFSHAGLRALLELLEQKRIRVVISAEHSLSDAVVALEESKRGAISGKLVITVD